MKVEKTAIHIFKNQLNRIAFECLPSVPLESRNSISIMAVRCFRISYLLGCACRLFIMAALLFSALGERTHPEPTPTSTTSVPPSSRTEAFRTSSTGERWATTTTVTTDAHNSIENGSLKEILAEVTKSVETQTNTEETARPTGNFDPNISRGANEASGETLMNTREGTTETAEAIWKEDTLETTTDAASNLNATTFMPEGTTGRIVVGKMQILNDMARIRPVLETSTQSKSKLGSLIDTNAILECTRKVKTKQSLGSPIPLRFYTGLHGQKFADTWKTTPSGRLMHLIYRFNYIGTVKGDMSWLHLCVGVYDITAHTYSGDPKTGGRPVAWVTLHTLSQHSVGIIKLETRCFRETIQYADCSPQYYPMHFMDNVPLFKYSVLEEEFWTSLSYSTIKVPFPWIWKINANINKSTQLNNIPSHWIYKMDIPTLDELKIQGNNWGRPDKIVRVIPRLAYLDLRDNNLEIIPQDMFNNVHYLRYLTLSYNNISQYPDGIKNLERLKYLDLSHSKSEKTISILEENIGMISGELSVLKLEGTKLAINFPNLFTLPQLIFLNLSHCHLTGFPSKNGTTLWTGSLLNDNKLIDLDLSWNRISMINIDALMELTELKTINLSENRIEYIDTGAFSYNMLLTIIDISHNRLKFIPNCLFCTLNNLREIDLSYNQLKQVPYLANVKLDFLGLSFNALNEFKQNDSFIEYVNLSHNNVSMLQISLVKKMNLSYNRLSVIGPEMWRNIIRLQIVDLGGNDFQCCLFRDASSLSLMYDTVIYNLGRLSPLTCKKNAGRTEYLLDTLDKKDSACSPDKENEYHPADMLGGIIAMSVVVILLCVVTLLLVYRRYKTVIPFSFSQK